MKHEQSVDGIVTILKIPPQHYFKLLHKKVTANDGFVYLVISMKEFIAHVEKRSASSQHWKYFFEGMLKN